MKFLQTIIELPQVGLQSQEVNHLGPISDEEIQYFYEACKQQYRNFIQLYQKKNELMLKETMLTEKIKLYKVDDDFFDNMDNEEQRCLKIKCTIKSCGKIMKSESAYQKHMKNHEKKHKKKIVYPYNYE